MINVTFVKIVFVVKIVIVMQDAIDVPTLIFVNHVIVLQIKNASLVRNVKI